MKQEKTKIVIYSLFLSAFFLWIGTKSSPLYAMNDWVDANAFFTMGKGWIHGLIPFKDLFEQKGPILYIVYGIGYLLSHKTFFGIYLIEIISMTFFLSYFYKILKLYHYEKGFYIASPFVMAVLLTMSAFVHGGSVEELLLPCFAVSLYHFLLLMKDKKYLEENRKIYYIEGLIVAIVLWTKFILLGFWIGFVFLLFIFFVKNHKWKLLGQAILYYSLGLLTITLPLLLYFGYHHALGDLWHTYFYLNIFLYPNKGEVITIGNRFYQLWKIFKGNIFENAIFSFSLLVGLLFVLKDKLVLKRSYKVTIFVLFLSTFFFNYIGLKNYRYYFFVMAPFVVFFGLFVARLATKTIFPTRYLVIITIPILWIFVYAFGPNIYFLKFQKSDLAQFRFAEIMNREEHPTLLNYGKIDGGFYTVADILPTEKYFEKVNINYEVFPENKDSQIEAIKEKRVEFVVVRLGDKTDRRNHHIPYLNENYEFVDEVYQEYDHKPVKYVLYQLKEDL